MKARAIGIVYGKELRDSLRDRRRRRISLRNGRNSLSGTIIALSYVTVS